MLADVPEYILIIQTWYSTPNITNNLEEWESETKEECTYIIAVKYNSYTCVEWELKTKQLLIKLVNDFVVDLSISQHVNII